MKVRSGSQRGGENQLRSKGIERYLRDFNQSLSEEKEESKREKYVRN